MLLLTNENNVIDTNLLGTKISGDVRYSVYDLSTKEPDYYFRPLVFLESFNDSSLQFTIGNSKIQIPTPWSIVVADPESGEVEIIPVEEINTARNFHAFAFNSITGYYPKFLEIKMDDLFSDVRWVFPKLEAHNFLLVPLENKENPDCIMIINEKDQKKLPQLSLEKLL